MEMIGVETNDNGGDNSNVNKDYNIKMTFTQDKPGTLINYRTTTPYISSGLKPGDQLDLIHGLNLYKHWTF